MMTSEQFASLESKLERIAVACEDILERGKKSDAHFEELRVKVDACVEDITEKHQKQAAIVDETIRQLRGGPPTGGRLLQ
jgi:ElaB/YqjD/DUF883 family membrane-anchored ribosome-binding protein